MSNKLTKMAMEILAIESDLPFRFDFSTGENPTIDDFELYTFEQTWGSTSLGFGGIGGQAITTANTYVFVPVTANQMCFVYFAGRFAYAVKCSELFLDDLMAHNIEPVYRAGKYYINQSNER